MIDQSTLYPLLRRLEKQELVTSSWDKTEVDLVSIMY